MLLRDLIAGEMVDRVGLSMRRKIFSNEEREFVHFVFTWNIVTPFHYKVTAIFSSYISGENSAIKLQSLVELIMDTVSNISDQVVQKKKVALYAKQSYFC